MRYDQEYVRHAEELTAAGVDPHGQDDTFTGTTFVYCAAHLRAHTTGWCTVSNVDKYPLKAPTYDEAQAEARTLGYRLYGEDSR